MDRISSFNRDTNLQKNWFIANNRKDPNLLVGTVTSHCKLKHTPLTHENRVERNLP